MAYVHDLLVRQTLELAQQSPAITENELSRRLGAHRHTLKNALDEAGLLLTKIKRETVLKALRDHCCKRGPAAPLKQVWSDLGFRSAGAFYRYVRRQTGMSPKQYCASLFPGPKR